MKLKNHQITKHFCAVAALSLLAFGSCTAWAQTGAYTLSSGSASLASLTETTSVSNQSGIYVYGSGTLTVGSVTVTTSGDSTNTDNSDKYGINAGILAGNASTKGTVVVTNGTVVTTGSVANGLFATYTGSSVTMLGGSINCSGANAHGVDATYGGSVTLSNVTVISSNANSSAIATDYGGGYVTMIGGSALAADTVSGSHSAAVYSTGVITVKGATVASLVDCGGVIDGANSIILTNTTMTGLLEGVKVWRTSSASGTATVILSGGSLTASAGDGFYVTGSGPGGGALSTITVLNGATVSASTGNILNSDSSSTAIFTVNGTTLAGNLIADSTSTNTITLTNSAALTGCINTAKQLTIYTNCTWNATSNSVVTALTNAGTINLTGKITTTNVLVQSGGIFGGSGTLSSNLTVCANATLVLNPTTNFVVGGKVIFAGAVTVAPSTSGISAGTYKLLTYSNSLSGTPTFTYSAPTGSGQTAVFNTATSGVIYVTISVPVTTPAAPTNLTATAGDTQVTLKWNVVTNATSYYVKRSFVSGGSYTNVSNSSTTNFASASLTNGTLYYFVVTATNSAGESAISSEVSARPTSSVSTNLTLTASSGTLTLSWPADHTGWKLQAQTNSLTAGLGTNWVDVASSTLTNRASISATTTNGSVFFRLVNQ
jgi:cytoskeletal protein CcmA (bactofilin family)